MTKLSEVQCRNARPKVRPYKLADGHGLYLYVRTNGSRLWRMDFDFDGKRKTRSFGPYPEITLEQARAAMMMVRQQKREGLDPCQEHKLTRVKAKYARRTTFGAVADELLEKMAREKRAPATIKKTQWLLKELAAPLEDRPIASLSPVEILNVLQKVEANGRLESARRLRAVIGQVIRLAVATNRATHDPTPALRGAIASPTVKHRAAILDRKGAGELMVTIGAYERPIVRLAMEILAYCFTRPGECRLAKWGEVNFEDRIWIIPAERTKMRREHRVPLSRQAFAKFEELWKISGGQTELCFPGQRGLYRPITENTVCAALRTLGYGQDEMTAHGFRAMASTLLHEWSPFSSESIERAMAHQDGNAIRRAYARGEHWEDRIKLMQWWADYLDALRDGRIEKPQPHAQAYVVPANDILGGYRASIQIVNVPYGTAWKG